VIAIALAVGRAGYGLLLQLTWSGASVQAFIVDVVRPLVFLVIVSRAILHSRRETANA
jgi:hypothetical protein